MMIRRNNNLPANTSKKPCPPFVLLVLGTIALLSCQPVQGVPYHILTTTAARCVQMDISRELVVTIEYEAPDVNAYPEDGKDKKEESKNRREAFAGQDMTLLVFQRDDESVSSEKKKPRREKKTGTGKVRMQVEQEKGDIQFYTGNNAGVLEICQQSYKATPSKPRRLALNVTKRAATVQEQLKNSPIRPGEEEIIPDKEQSNSILSVETSQISLELNRMDSLMDELYGHAEHSKDIEQDFHGKTVRLNSAVRFWPMFRIAVVICAGIAQVVVVIKYMRSKHIY